MINPTREKEKHDISNSLDFVCLLFFVFLEYKIMEDIKYINLPGYFNYEFKVCQLHTLHVINIFKDFPKEPI